MKLSDEAPLDVLFDCQQTQALKKKIRNITYNTNEHSVSLNIHCLSIMTCPHNYQL